MATSQNGWPVIEQYGPPSLTGNVEIPGTGGVKVLGGLRSGDVATVLLWIAQQWHKRVRPLTQDEGIWGYNYRPVRGGSTLSNHSSGTAIDLSSAVFPMGSRNMTAAQRAAARAIAAEADVVRWGGEWSGSGVDEMHYEINASAADVAAAAKRLASNLPKPEQPSTPTDNGTPTPTPEKDWFDMATQAEVQAALSAALKDLKIPTPVVSVGAPFGGPVVVSTQHAGGPSIGFYRADGRIEYIGDSKDVQSMMGVTGQPRVVDVTNGFWNKRVTETGANGTTDRRVGV